MTHPARGPPTCAAAAGRAAAGLGPVGGTLLARDLPAEPILQPWALTSRLSLRIVWPDDDARPEQPPALSVSGSASLSDVQLTVTSLQLAHLAHAMRVASAPGTALDHLPLPLPASAATSAAPGECSRGACERGTTREQRRHPRERWRHAIGAVRADQAFEQRSLSWRALKARVLVQRAYELAYNASIRRTAVESSSHYTSVSAPPLAAAVEAALVAALAATAAAAATGAGEPPLPVPAGGAPPSSELARQGVLPPAPLTRQLSEPSASSACSPPSPTRPLAPTAAEALVPPVALPFTRSLHRASGALTDPFADARAYVSQHGRRRSHETVSSQVQVRAWLRPSLTGPNKPK